MQGSILKTSDEKRGTPNLWDSLKRPPMKKWLSKQNKLKTNNRQPIQASSTNRLVEDEGDAF
jgi:hypothetical protein